MFSVTAIVLHNSPGPVGKSGKEKELVAVTPPGSFVRPLRFDRSKNKEHFILAACWDVGKAHGRDVPATRQLGQPVM